MLHFPLRDLLVAWLVATVFSGLPSTLHALVTGGDPLEATRAAGAMLLPASAGTGALFAAAAVVHPAVSLFWTAMFGALLPRRRVTLWALIGAAAVAWLDLRVIAPLLFPSVAALPFWPQFADHLMWGTLLGGTLEWRLRRAPPGGACGAAAPRRPENVGNSCHRTAPQADTGKTGMAEEEEQDRALSHVLDQLESSAHGESVTVDEVVEKLGHHSFAALMLIFSLITASPASAIPGLTATVAAIVFILVVQMIFGRECVWLPGFITHRRMSTAKLCKGIGWVRKPVAWIERLLKPRLEFLFHRPWLYLPLILILALTLFMPFMEVVPTSGSIASIVIALFAAGLLTRDGALVVISLIALLAVPVSVWYFA